MARHSKHQRSGITYASACDLIEHALSDGMRSRILDAITAYDGFGGSAMALRNAMRTHTFPTGAEVLRLHPIVQSFDARAQRTGLHVLQSWDYVAHRFAPNSTPVLMLDRFARDDTPVGRQRDTLSVLLDHYFVSVLGLIVVRAWDEGDTNDNLDRVSSLLHALQRHDSSNCRFVTDAETLLLLAVSHYHPDEAVYEQIARRFDALTDARRRRMAEACAAVLGGHLRWGLRHMYRRDVALMHADNVVDYPFVVYGVLTLLRDFEAERSAGIGGLAHARTVEALLNGLSADPTFATNRTPHWLRSHRAEHGELRERLLDNRETLMAELAGHQPSARRYSPLGFDANFLCNTVVAMIGTALAEPEVHASLNMLFTRLSPHDAAGVDAEQQAHAMMRYAMANRIGTGAPLVVYDPYEAAHAFNMTNAALRNAAVSTR